MPTKIKIRTPEGKTKTVSLSDVRPYWLYDTATIDTTTTEYRFFQTPSGKTIHDTNLQQFSTIQIGWTLEVHTIRIVPRPSITIADMELIAGDAVVSFLREGIEEIFTLPLVMLNAGCGLSGATTNTAEDVVSLGTPASGAVLKMPIRFLLYGGETFNFKLQYAAALSALSTSRKIYMVLDGVLKKGIRGA
jgi:hypothetical protein